MFVGCFDIAVCDDGQLLKCLAAKLVEPSLIYLASVRRPLVHGCWLKIQCPWWQVSQIPLVVLLRAIPSDRWSMQTSLGIRSISEKTDPVLPTICTRISALCAQQQGTEMQNDGGTVCKNRSSGKDGVCTAVENFHTHICGPLQLITFRQDAKLPFPLPGTWENMSDSKRKRYKSPLV